MNIYNFIFCFFCKKYGNSGPGRIYGSGMLLFTVIIHFALIRELISCFIDSDFFAFSHIVDKGKYYFHVALITFALVFFYDSKRVERLMEKYYSRDEYVQQGDTNRVILIIVVPIILICIIMPIRQKYLGI